MDLICEIRQANGSAYADLRGFSLVGHDIAFYALFGAALIVGPR